jgi:hypothetical protein
MNPLRAALVQPQRVTNAKTFVEADFQIVTGAPMEGKAPPMEYEETSDHSCSQ